MTSRAESLEKTGDPMALRRETVRDLILYHYALLIADAAICGRVDREEVERRGKNYWTFAARRYNQLRRGQISPSAILRENKMLVASGNLCAYCGAGETALQWEHIIPRSKGGPDLIDNMVLACAACNNEKGARDPVEWYGERRPHIPRLVMGKFLKLVYEEHQRMGTLNDRVCPGTEELNTAGLSAIFRIDPS